MVQVPRVIYVLRHLEALYGLFPCYFIVKLSIISMVNTMVVVPGFLPRHNHNAKGLCP